MSKKSYVVVAFLFAVAVLTSSAWIRGEVFKMYDKLTLPASFDLSGKRYTLSGGWLVDGESDGRVTVRRAGLAEDNRSLAVFYAKDSSGNPCANVGQRVRVHSYSVIRCRVNNKETGSDLYVYDVEGYDVFVMFLDGRSAEDLLLNFSISK